MLALPRTQVKIVQKAHWQKPGSTGQGQGYLLSVNSRQSLYSGPLTSGESSSPLLDDDDIGTPAASFGLT